MFPCHQVNGKGPLGALSVKAKKVLKKANKKTNNKVDGKPECKKCHGRGYIGIDIITNEYISCDCLELKNEEPQVSSLGQEGKKVD